MLDHPTAEKLDRLGLKAFARALRDQKDQALYAGLSFEERLGLLADQELTGRESRGLARRLTEAKLRQNACLEDIDFRAARGLDRSLLAKLGDCAWVRQGHNVLVTGPTGAGKTYLACSLAQKACREGHNALYIRMGKLLREFQIARGDGSLGRLLASLGRRHVLVIDDWGLASFSEEARHDLFELIEERHGKRSLVIASQLPIENWHETIGEPTLADAILDRLVHRAYKIQLKGGSMRKIQALENETDQ